MGKKVQQGEQDRIQVVRYVHVVARYTKRYTLEITFYYCNIMVLCNPPVPQVPGITTISAPL
jgi:hypothetical protein